MPIAPVYFVGAAITALGLCVSAVYAAARTPGRRIRTLTLIAAIPLFALWWPITVPVFGCMKIADIAGATWPARMLLWASSLNQGRRPACQFADLVERPLEPWPPCTARATSVLRAQGRVFGLCDAHRALMREALPHR